MASCCVRGCPERQVKGGPVSFHIFPKDAKMKRVWEKSIQRGFRAANGSRICSKHFVKSCFEQKLERTRLKKNAVPTSFNFPNNSKKTGNSKKTSLGNLKKTSLGNSKKTVIRSLKKKSNRVSNESKKDIGKEKENHPGDLEENNMMSLPEALQALEAAKQEVEDRIICMNKMNNELCHLGKQVYKLKGINNLHNTYLAMLRVTAEGNPLKHMLIRSMMVHGSEEILRLLEELFTNEDSMSRIPTADMMRQRNDSTSSLNPSIN